MSKGALTTGLILISTIFTILVVSIFSILTIQMYNQEVVIKEAILKNERNYQCADEQADVILTEILSGTLDPLIVDIQQIGSNRLASYNVKIDEDKQLSVEVLLKNGSYEILKWEQEYIGDWVLDNSITLWDGLSF